MRQHPVSARIFIAAVVGFGAADLLCFGRPPARGHFGEFAALIVAAIVSSAFKLKLPTKTRVTLSPSFVIDFASLLILGPGSTLLVAAAGSLAHSTVLVRKRQPLHQVLFNVSSLVMAVLLASGGYLAVGGTVGRLTWPAASAPIFAALVVYFFVQSTFIALAVALTTGRPVQMVWRENLVWIAPCYFVGALVAALMAEAVERGIWALILLGAAPVYMVFRTYGVYVGRLEEADRHRDAIESLNEGIAVIKYDGRVAIWNDALERMVGCPRGDVVGRPLIEAVPALAGTIVPQAISQVFRTGQPGVLEHLTLTRDTGRRIFQVRVLPFDGGVTVLWHDVTDQADAEDVLRQSEERYALAASGSNDGLWDWDLVRKEIYCSPRWRAMVGLPAKAAHSGQEEWFDRVHLDDREAFQAALDAHVVGASAHFQHEYRMHHEDGTYRWVLCRGVAVRRADGIATRLAGSQTDISERVMAHEQLRRAALHDTLTGLPNRALFLELLGPLLERGKRHPEHEFAVLFLDIDRFKVVNDSLGHLVGDELLAGISRRLESCLRDGDVLARLGGDEFTILLTDLTHPSQATLVAERIQDVLRAPFLVAGRELFTTASIGVALSAPHYTRPEDIMRDADTAMYRAKACGKARHALFDAAMHATAVERFGFEHDLRGALERREFALHYQPLVSLTSGQWTGFEALLRWERGGRVVAPSEFIPVAEEMGLIEPLGTWVLAEACRQAAAWRRRFPHGSFAGITVNVSTRQLVRPDFLSVIQRALKDATLRPSDLRLEITESVLMDDPERAEVILRDLRRLGVKIYLDDFGTGYSSLSYLHRFPVDSLKIDRSFVASLTEGSERPAIIESIVMLAKTLKTQVIAEGVETERQVYELTRMGCTEAQGFFFGRPLPAGTAEALLAGPPPSMHGSRLDGSPLFSLASTAA